jgi:L-asparaginase/Glu-tRNA(Gln) amidotransferase subunit D
MLEVYPRVRARHPHHPKQPNQTKKTIRKKRNTRMLLSSEGAYRPRFKLDPAVVRIPIVPGSDPRATYGDLAGRGVRGVVLEAFGVGNMPDSPSMGWLPWLKEQTKKGVRVCLTSQCARGDLKPDLYRAGAAAMALGVEAGPQMTPECAVAKLMICLAHPDLPLGVALAGEL